MKLFSSAYALILMMFSLKFFKAAKEFENKRIAIVGAADSVFDEENGEEIDGYDIVIRLNRAPHSWKEQDKNFLGNKFDILYHSFYENNYSGGGPIDWELYDSMKIKKVVNPIFNKKGLYAHFNYYKRHLLFKKTFILSSREYRKGCEELEGFKPTVGYMALSTVLYSRCKEVFITGFSFFKTPYIKGYREELKDVNKNNQHIAKQGLHNPELEFQAFKKALALTSCENIIMDKELERILQESEVKM